MKSSINPVLENLEQDTHNSFLYKRFDEENLNPYSSWHYHPELEIVYVNSGAGKRQIGTHLSHYRNGDLILIGSNLPHSGFTGNLKRGQRESVIQWKPNAFGEQFFNIPEMAEVKGLFQKALQGIIFHGDEKRFIGSKIEALEALDNYEKIIGLLEVFKLMARAENYTVLNAGGFMLEAKIEDQNRINTVFNFVRENFRDPISLEVISNFANMTPSSFCKYFKKITNETFVQFVTEYRLVHAAKLLHESNLGVADICYECGFNNYSHFTKKFKEKMGKTPLNYRNELKFTLTDNMLED